MVFGTDGKGQIFVEWAQGPHGFKRAWVRKPILGSDEDWAGTGRYINVVRIAALGQGPAGNSTDFPVFNMLPDDQVLVAFVAAVCGVTGCTIP